MPTNYLAQTKSPGLISYFYGKTIVPRGGKLGGGRLRLRLRLSPPPHMLPRCHTVDADADGDARQTKD